jgi:CheY-like chemotaxis protein
MKQTGKVLIAVDDMFFAAKILSAAQNVGRQVERVKSAEEVRQAVANGVPALLIIDLNSTRMNAIELIAGLKSQPAFSAVPVLGFLSHVQVELKQQAEAAGCDRVLPRSAFAQKLTTNLSGDLS